MLDNEKKNDIKNSTFLSNYYETLKNFPPLTKEEERVLLKRYKEDNDISARQKLITSNLRYALKYVINYNNKKNVPLEDLIAEANIGLIKAVDEFNLSNENRIISYANWKMLFSLQEATKNEDNINNDDYEINNLSCEDDVEHCDKECFEQYYDEDEQDSGQDINNNDGYVDYYEDEYGAYQIKELIDTLLSDLSGREYDMICMYYGVNEYKKEHTLNEIGEKHNITKERVRQIIEKCKRKMIIKALVENKYYA